MNSFCNSSNKLRIILNQIQGRNRIEAIDGSVNWIHFHGIFMLEKSLSQFMESRVTSALFHEFPLMPKLRNFSDFMEITLKLRIFSLKITENVENCHSLISRYLSHSSILTLNYRFHLIIISTLNYRLHFIAGMSSISDRQLPSFWPLHLSTNLVGLSCFATFQRPLFCPLTGLQLQTWSKLLTVNSMLVVCLPSYANVSHYAPITFKMWS